MQWSFVSEIPNVVSLYQYPDNLIFILITCSFYPKALLISLKQ